ncbi:MAG: hypothetical protein ACO3FI_02470 [Cyclobacteriaceae bacterium]
MLQSKKIKTASLIIQITFYLFAGINHFINPEFYYPLIPEYLSDFKLPINIVSGLAEIILALLLITAKTRRIAGVGIIIMLIAFIPSHVFFITAGIDSVGHLQVSPMMAWIRLLVIHPLLILWAFSISREHVTEKTI